MAHWQRQLVIQLSVGHQATPTTVLPQVTHTGLAQNPRVVQKLFGPVTKKRALLHINLLAEQVVEKLAQQAIV